MRCPSARGRNDRNAHPKTNSADRKICQRCSRRRAGSAGVLSRPNPMATSNQATMFTTPIALMVLHQSITPGDASSTIWANK